MSICVSDSAYSTEIQDSETASNLVVKSKKYCEVKLPPFFESDPELWFALADNTFNAYGIKHDAKKFLLIIENLEIKYARMYRDEILKGSCDYNGLKKQIIKAFRDNLTKKLESEKIGERTPKEFLSHLKSMTGVWLPETSLQIIWRQQLPEDVRAMLQLYPNRNLATEAETAELMSKMFGAAAKEKNKVEKIMEKVDSMALEIEQLKRRISELEDCDDNKVMAKRQRSKSCTEDDV